jgi:hypothetical protein
MFRPYFDHIQALIYIIWNEGGLALKMYFVICEISRILQMQSIQSSITCSYTLYIYLSVVLLETYHIISKIVKIM